MEFKQGKAYLTRAEDGSMVKMSSVFSVESGGMLYLTLYGSHVGEEELGEFRFPSENFVRQVSWQEWFEEWIKVKLDKVSWDLDHQLEAKLQQYELRPQIKKPTPPPSLAIREGSTKVREIPAATRGY
jgi:hypothetical protein